MNRWKANVWVILSLLIISPVLAQTYFDIEMACQSGCNTEEADANQPIMLELTLKNNYNKWLKFGEDEGDRNSPSFKLISSQSGLDDGQEVNSYRDLFGNPLYLAPKESVSFYLPLDSYNSQTTNDRIGNWEIKGGFTTGQVTYFSSPFDGDEARIRSDAQIESLITTNALVFNAQKDSVMVFKNPLDWVTKTVVGWFSSWIGWMVATILVGVILAAIKKNYF